MKRSVIRARPGQALVEFVMVLPIFLLLVLGVVEFGRCLQAYQAVTDTAREAARVAAVANGASQTDVVNRINELLALARLDSTLATKSVQKLPNGWPGASGDTVQVDIAYPYTFGFLAPFVGWAGADATITLRTRMFFRNE